MLKFSTLLVTFSLLLFVVLIHAQGTVVTSVQAGQGNGTGVGSGRGMIGGVGSFSTSNGVPGQPFSADVLDETDKFLTDGNHIHHESHGRIFRDSQGRIRKEIEFGRFSHESKPKLFVAITDMEGQFMIHLDVENKIATVTHFPQRSGTGSPSQPAKTPLQSQAVAATPLKGSPATPESSFEDLGTKQIEGFIVNGTRHTYTVPAGQVGNDKPLTTTSERWFSPDLKMDLLNSSESPESGKHVYKILNIHTGDPDPLLFQVPSDFTIKEAPQQ